MRFKYKQNRKKKSTKNKGGKEKIKQNDLTKRYKKKVYYKQLDIKKKNSIMFQYDHTQTRY